MYLITGATGGVGREVMAQLVEAGVPVRAFTRDANKLKPWAGRVEVAVGDLNDPASVGRAAAGAEAAFLILQGPPPESFPTLLGELKRAGVDRVVFLSSMAATWDLAAGRWHKQAEDAIATSGLRHVFLRPGGFMSNCLQWIPTIRAEGAVHNPMGAAKLPLIAPEDIAAVAVKRLREPNGDAIVTMTGGEALTTAEQVEALAEAVGRPLRCVEVDLPTHLANLGKLGMPPFVVAAMGEFLGSMQGQSFPVLPTLEQELGRPAMRFAAWAERHAAAFA